MNLFGRRVIKTDAVSITDANVLEELQDAMYVHLSNYNEIKYLWEYYCGNQPVLQRTKKVRPDICNKIVENRANEIVSFKVGYLCGEPIQYVGRNGDEKVSKAISELNEMMYSENKASQDRDIIEWQMVCGTSYRLVLPDSRGMEDDAPFELYTLDPRDTFVVYSNDVGNRPIFGVKYRDDKKNARIYSVYSANHYWLIKDNQIIESKPHALGSVPIFEYPANNARLGAFEIVIDLLDAINTVASNRLDGIEQFVQAFMKFINCDIDSEEYKKFLELGAIKVKSTDGVPADVDMICNELNQSQTQTIVDDMYNAVLTICGMPNRNGGTSTSDTGAAVVLRDGWSNAETRAKDSETMFKQSELEMLKLILRIIRDSDGLSQEVHELRLKNIAMQFTRRNYENSQGKSQVLTTMLNSDKIHPRLAFEQCGMFTDPENAYQMSMKYKEEQTPIVEDGGNND